MLQKTHSAAGLVAAELVIVQQQIPFLSWEAAAAALIGCLAGPLADVDKPGSTMAKVLFPISLLLRALDVKHRTMTHSLLFIAALAFALSALPPLYLWALIAAYASHPLLDLFNETGVQLLWPLKGKIRLLPKWMAVTTGSSVETAIRWILLLVSLWIPGSTLLLGLPPF